MQFFKYLLITIVIIALVDPTDGGWLKKTVKKIGRGIKRGGKRASNGIRKIGRGAKKIGCRIAFGVGCPVAVGALGSALAAGSSGIATTVVAIGVVAGTRACHVRKRRCKRSVNMTEVVLPFSDEISDYDFNGDKLVTFNEFMFAVLRSVDMADPEELREPFDSTDFDGNGVLDTDEFNGAPFIFAHVPWYSQHISPSAA